MRSALFCFGLVLTFFTSSAYAWDKHQAIMMQVTDSLPALRRDYLVKPVTLPSVADEKKMIATLAEKLQINGAKVPVFTESTAAKAALTVRDLIQGTFIDEPDLGMDQDLPHTADVSNDRAWMGGSTGPTSQGFRHMYFSGLVFSSPIETLQVPFRAVGQAPERFKKLKAVSDEFFKEGNLFWGVRTLMWSLHLVQDLNQPFHVAQIPDRHMVPWKKLFSNFVAETTHALSNYHYAYEGLALEYMHDARVTEFNKCFDIENAVPVSDIMQVIAKTREVAPALGKAAYTLFGDEMKSPEVDLPNAKGSIDYYQLLHQRENPLPSNEDQKELPTSQVKELRAQLDGLNALKEVRILTCELMKRVATSTWGELDRAFHYSDNSSNIGK